MNAKRILSLLFVAMALFLVGCADIRQEVHMNHDGSGKIVEKISVTARGYRLLEGMQKRGGQGASQPALISEEAFQERMKSMGAVELVPGSKKVVDLSDGRKQFQATYTFKDANKINLWTAPSLSYIKPEKGGAFTGKMNFKFTPEFSKTYGGRTTTYREDLRVTNVSTGIPFPEMRLPAGKQRYLRVLPIFLDMLKDFHLSVELFAPIEEFDDTKMVSKLFKVDANKVTLYRVDGKSAVQAPGLILQLIMNEVIGGRSLNAQTGSMPEAFHIWPGRSHAYIRFMKAVVTSNKAAPKKKSDDGGSKKNKRSRKKKESKEKAK